MSRRRRTSLLVLACLLLLGGGCTVEVHYPGPGVNKWEEEESRTDVAESEVPVLPPTYHISSVFPAMGDVVGGTRVTIVGQLFTPPVQVFFGEKEATYILQLDNQTLKVDTPPGDVGPVHVRVIRKNGDEALLEGGFVYTSDVQITGVFPSAGPIQGGTPLTLEGGGFFPGSQVLIGGRLALHSEVVDLHTMVAIAPEGEAGPADVFVSNQEGFARLRDGYRFVAPMALHQVHPPNGPAEGGGIVNLMGVGLAGVHTVLFNGAEAEIVQGWGDDTLTVIAPSGAPGSVDLELISEDGYLWMVAAYAYTGAGLADGTLLSAMPQEGSVVGGTEVIITVSGLSSMETPTVEVGGNVAEILHVDSDAHSLAILTPPGEVGWSDLSVMSEKGASSLGNAFYYVPAIQINGVAPTSGPATGGTELELSGFGFSAGVEVRVGALPVQSVEVLSDTSLRVVTPPGSPGSASIRVRLLGAEAALKDVFHFTTNQVQVLALKPTHGSVAGGTFVRIFGTGFGGDSSVEFGGGTASEVIVHSSILMTARTPSAEVSTVDVNVEIGGKTKVMKEAFSYFDPGSVYGGTWGEAVDEAVNITVLDASNGEGVAEAYVILWAENDTPYQGNANEQGQITFSGPGLLKDQMVTASKGGYSTHSVVEFDATNITIYLTPYTSGGGGGVDPPLPGTVSGRIFGIDKYVILPPGSCENKLLDPFLIYCHPCGADADCGDQASCLPISEGATYCTTACNGDAECPGGYACAAVPGGAGAHCVPSPGKKAARCFISEMAMFVPALDPGPGAVATYDSNKGSFTYEITSRIGEVAVLCEGGFEDGDTGEFSPTILGVRRHVFVVSDQELEDQDIDLTIPLSRTLEVRLDEPPLQPGGPDLLGVDLYMELGSDGWISFGSDGGVSSEASFVFPNLPAQLSGPLFDATYSIYAGSYSGQDRGLPYSIAQVHKVVQTGEDAIFARGGSGEWSAISSSVSEDLRDIHMVEDKTWVVGDAGVVLHRNGVFWDQQSTPTKADLHAVWGSSADHALAVGEDGTVLHFNGFFWEEESAPTAKDLEDVWMTAEGDAFAAGWYVLMFRGASGWQIFEGAPEHDYRTIWGSGPEDVWAMGAYGAAVHYDGTGWTEVSLPTEKTIHGLWGLSSDFIFAVGEHGTVLFYDGTAWTQESGIPTGRSLKSVWGIMTDTGPSVTAVGAGGIILHYDGTEWKSESYGVTVSELCGVWGKDSLEGAVAVGTRSLLVGPFLQIPSLLHPDVGAQGDEELHYAMEVASGVEPHFRFIFIMLNTGFPLWSLVLDGDVLTYDLPDLLSLAGLDVLPLGQKRVRVFSVYREGFDIDHYDNLDFKMSEWNAWSIVDFLY